LYFVADAREPKNESIYEASGSEIGTGDSSDYAPASELADCPSSPSHDEICKNKVPEAAKAISAGAR
jgi:hypothetical protein